MITPRKILMIEPTFFEVKYAINPHMFDSGGQLQKVDPHTAKLQWEKVKKAYIDLGLQVNVRPGQKDLPDMVFCANPALPFIAREDRKVAIISRMKSPQRAPETLAMREYLVSEGHDILELPENLTFEGTGDAIWNNFRSQLYCGYGFRTQAEVPEILEKLTGRPVVDLKLIDERFYHLDTCFSILSKDAVAYIPEAFDKESLAKIQNSFSKLIKISVEEGVRAFAGNCFSPDGHHVLLNPGAPQFLANLKALGFEPIELDTSEFIKAGGSVFCMKLAHW